MTLLAVWQNKFFLLLALLIFIFFFLCIVLFITILRRMTSASISSWSYISASLKVFSALFGKFFNFICILANILMILKVDSFDVMHRIVFTLFYIFLFDSFTFVLTPVNMENEFFFLDFMTGVERTCYHNFLLIH